MNITAFLVEEREVEEEVKDKVKEMSEMELGLRSLVDRYGFQKIADTFVRMTQKA